MSAVMITPSMGVIMGPLVPPDVNDKVAVAAHRLALSRNHLHQAVDMTTAEKPMAEHQSATGFATGLATSAINQWWLHHPLRVVSHVTLDAAKTLVQPVAQRHPVALVAGAAVVGALLVWGRPWRWLVAPAVLAGVLPKLVSQVLKSTPWADVTSSVTKNVAKRMVKSAPKEPTEQSVARAIGNVSV